MGLTDRFKELAKQAQDAVAEHADKLHEAVDAAGVAANEKTQGKHASFIQKVGDKTSEAINKMAGTGESAPDSEADAAAGAEASGAPTAATAEPTATAGGPTATSPKPPVEDGGFPSFDE
jgi:hypothetical protein